MNQTAVEDLFLREKTIKNDIVGEDYVVESEAKDWRKWGKDRTKDLVVSAWLVGPKSDGKVVTFGAGELTLVLQTKNADDENWTELVPLTGLGQSDVDDFGRIAVIQLAGLALKQFVRVVVTVTTQWTVSGVATAPKLTVGLDNDTCYDIDATLVEDRAENPAAR